MDPVSILGLIASVGGVADIVSRSISKLSHFRAKYREAPFIIAVLLGQLCTIRTALDQLEEWSKNNLDVNPRYKELSRQLEDALMSFQPLLAFLDNQLEIHDQEENKQVTRKKRMSFVWKEQDLKGYFQMLDCQVNALTLLLQAVQCKTWTEQSHLMATVDSKMILRSAKDCSSSMMAPHDGMSIRNTPSTLENGDAMSRRFDFDRVLLHSRVYGAAYRSHLKQVVKPTQRSSRPVETISVQSNEATNVHQIDNLSIVGTPPNLAPRADLRDDLFYKLRYYYWEGTSHIVKMDDSGTRSYAPQKRYAVLFDNHLLPSAKIALTEFSQIQSASVDVGHGNSVRTQTELGVGNSALLLGQPLSCALGWIVELLFYSIDEPGFRASRKEHRCYLRLVVFTHKYVKGGRELHFLTIEVHVEADSLHPHQKFFRINVKETREGPTRFTAATTS